MKNSARTIMRIALITALVMPLLAFAVSMYMYGTQDDPDGFFKVGLITLFCVVMVSFFVFSTGVWKEYFGKRQSDYSGVWVFSHHDIKRRDLSLFIVGDDIHFNYREKEFTDKQRNCLLYLDPLIFKNKTIHLVNSFDNMKLCLIGDNSIRESLYNNIEDTWICVSDLKENECIVFTSKEAYETVKKLIR